MAKANGIKHLGTSSFVAARRALVLLDMLRSSWSDLHTLPMKPFLAHVAANPEIRSIVISTSST